MALIYFIGSYLFDVKLKNDFRRFDSTYLCGKITYVYNSSGGSRFRTGDSVPEFHFSPQTGWLKGKGGFLWTPEIGDSVIKEAFADTIILRKKGSGNKYLYTFDKEK